MRVENKARYLNSRGFVLGSSGRKGGVGVQAVAQAVGMASSDGWSGGCDGRGKRICI